MHPSTSMVVPSGDGTCPDTISPEHFGHRYPAGSPANTAVLMVLRFAFGMLRFSHPSSASMPRHVVQWCMDPVSITECR